MRNGIPMCREKQTGRGRCPQHLQETGIKKPGNANSLYPRPHARRNRIPHQRGVSGQVRLAILVRKSSQIPREESRQGSLAVGRHVHPVLPSLVRDDLDHQGTIPNYNLKACYDAIPELHRKGPLTMRKSLSCPRLRLWDEDRQQLVGFAN